MNYPWLSQSYGAVLCQLCKLLFIREHWVGGHVGILAAWQLTCVCEDVGKLPDDDSTVQDLVQSLQVLEVIAPAIDETLQPQVL